MLDPDMSPLGFNTEMMYDFISNRFQQIDWRVKQQALEWLRTLTILEIQIPLSHIFSMFNNCTVTSDEDELNLSGECKDDVSASSQTPKKSNSTEGKYLPRNLRFV